LPVLISKSCSYMLPSRVCRFDQRLDPFAAINLLGHSVQWTCIVVPRKQRSIECGIFLHLVLREDYERASELSAWDIYPVGSRIGSRQVFRTVTGYHLLMGEHLRKALTSFAHGIRLGGASHVASLMPQLSVCRLGPSGTLDQRNNDHKRQHQNEIHGYRQ
jgi:hypothetical protein